MRIEDLPRLTDEERDALDGGYVAIEGVPITEAPKPVRFPRLANILVAIVTAIGLTARSLTPAQKKWAGVLITGAVIAHQTDNGGSPPSSTLTQPNLPCPPQPDGSCR